MQVVSSQFANSTGAPYRQLAYGVLISWNKQTASGIQYFKIGTSVIGGSDPLKSTGGGTIAVASQYAYQTIPASGIVSWQTDMKLDQYPYGLIRRQADIVLSNASTAFLPASGTNLGPYIDYGRPMIIQAGFNAETIAMFTGYSDSPQNDIVARTTTLHGYDAVTFLDSYTSTATPPQFNQSKTDIMTTLLEEAGFSPSQFILEKSLDPVLPYFDPYGLTLGQIFDKFCESEAGIMFADESGIIHFWNRQHFANTSTSVATLTYSGSSNWQMQNSPVINSVEVISTPAAIVSGVQQVFTLDQPYYLQAAGVDATNSLPNASVESGTVAWPFGTRQNVDSAFGNWAMSGNYITYTGIRMLTNRAYPIQFSAKMPPTVSGTAYLIFRDSGVPSSYFNIKQKVAISGNGQWNAYNLYGTPNNIDQIAANSAELVVSGANTSRGILVDGITDSIWGPFFDGTFPPSNPYTYSWSGAPYISPSIRKASPQYLQVACSLSSETFSLVAPIASGIGATIPANTSFYSFSSISGVGGIYGTDLTANISLVNYSVSGTTAYLVFKNNSPTQAYLTNLQLYGNVANNPTLIDQKYYDQTSMTKYGINPSNLGQPFIITNDYVPNSSTARGLAEYLVQGFSSPLLRFTVDNFAIPQLQFGDCVNLSNKDTGETRIGYVLGIKNSMSKDGTFSQQLIVQERQLASYFTIGTSKIGGSDQIAP